MTESSTSEVILFVGAMVAAGGLAGVLVATANEQAAAIEGRADAGETRALTDLRLLFDPSLIHFVATDTVTEATRADWITAHQPANDADSDGNGADTGVNYRTETDGTAANLVDNCDAEFVVVSEPFHVYNPPNRAYLPPGPLGDVNPPAADIQESDDTGDRARTATVTAVQCLYDLTVYAINSGQRPAAPSEVQVLVNGVPSSLTITAVSPVAALADGQIDHGEIVQIVVNDVEEHIEGAFDEDGCDPDTYDQDEQILGVPFRDYPLVDNDPLYNHYDDDPNGYDRTIVDPCESYTNGEHVDEGAAFCEGGSNTMTLIVGTTAHSMKFNFPSIIQRPAAATTTLGACP